MNIRLINNSFYTSTKTILSCIVITLLFTLNSARAQSLTFHQVKEVKNVLISDIIQFADQDIVYPVTGIVDIQVRISYAQVEIWVIDAKGRVVYNTMIADKDGGKEAFDKDYCRYMMRQGKEIIKQRHYNPEPKDTLQ